MKLGSRLMGVALAALVTAPGVRAERSMSLAGLWVTEGYGFLLDFGADSLTAYETTSVSCVRAFTAKSAAAPAGALGAFSLADEPVTFVVLPDGAANRARVHVPFAASDMIIHPIDRRPAVCEKPTPDTPQSNFDTFVTTWSQHYPFFAQKRVEWPAVVAANRNKITDTTTPEDLFTILAGLISPFEDAHTFIDARVIKKTYQGVRRTPSFLPGATREEGYRLVDAHLAAPLQKFCEGRVEFGMLAPDVGYLRIRSFSGYTKDGAFESGLEALEAALDASLAASKSWKGLVIDVRLNGGGADPYGLAIAGHLTGTAYTAYDKQARSDPADATKWTPGQPGVVQPSRGARFLGPVVELIGIQSVSAAETFTQALMTRTPKVIRIGENTQGVFSDVLERHLPNGWRFGLPNERFVTDGKSYDGPGIAPDIAVESFTPAARATGRDRAIVKALEVLTR